MSDTRPDTDRLAALLHELGIGCMQPYALSRDVCLPTDPRYADYHLRTAARLIAAGVRVGEHDCFWGGPRVIGKPFDPEAFRLDLTDEEAESLRATLAPTDTLREAAKAFIDDPIDLMDPENAPACHGEWRPTHRPMGDTSVILVDDDDCNLFVDALDVAYLVNRSVALRAALATSEATPVYCDVCPHAMYLHNPDGSCGCGSDCFTAALATSEESEP